MSDHALVATRAPPSQVVGPPAAVPARWNDEFDVIVVGFGGAGACAAIEAVERGARVLALDRFAGGGATAISGGVVYAGGGTQIQAAAGVRDTPDQMRRYLALEVDDVVAPATLERFCRDSVANLEWLQAHGVPFDATLCPVKTSYPPDGFYLYYSGNEAFEPFRSASAPAPRGHRARGTGLPGANFYAPLRAAALAAGVDLRPQHRVRRLIVDDGRVAGVVASRIEGAWARARHGWLSATAIKLNPYAPQVARSLRAQAEAIERRHGRQVTFLARRGVVLTTGGFIYNRAMVEAHAPAYRPGMPLGTAGCSGDGVALGQSVGGAAAHMDRVSAWRFINPPEAFSKGILVDRAGQRVANERLYGAQVGRAMVERHNGQAILILDQTLFDEALRQCRPGTGIHWFQQAPALINLFANRRKAPTLAALAAAARIDPAALAATVARYNAAAAGAGDDEMGKERDYAHALERGPFYAIDCGLRSRRFPCPTLTLGGLRVSEETGAVIDDDGHPVPGLFAAGRTAVGICTNDYVSGLSLADCVFGGRRAGASAAEG